MSRTSVACQALVMMVALVGSVAAGRSTVEQAAAGAAAESVFAARPALAPSTLLLGEHT